ncbi:hypothetical protein Tco_1337129 [Tanacetum coccineum]
MFEDNSYKAHEVHNDLYEALQKSLELDYSNQCLADQEEAHKKKRKKRAAPRTPSRSPPSPPPPLPPLAGASSALDIENNWASTLVSTYETPTKNSLLAKTGDMTTFIKWYCRQVNKTTLTQADFEGQPYEVVKAFYPNVIHLQFQMEECHKMFTVQNMASRTGSLIDRSSILTDMILRRVEKMLEHICGFSVSSEFKHTQDTGHLDNLPGSDKRLLSTTVKPWTRNLSQGIQGQAAQYMYEYVIMDSKGSDKEQEFIAAIERRLKTRRIFQNLECFVGGRVRDIDYRLL